MSKGKSSEYELTTVNALGVGNRRKSTESFPSSATLHDFTRKLKVRVKRIRLSEVFQSRKVRLPDPARAVKSVRNVRVCLRRIPFEKHTLQRNDHSSTAKHSTAVKDVVNNWKRIGQVGSSITKPGLKKPAEKARQVKANVPCTQCVEKPGNSSTSTSVPSKEPRSSVTEWQQSTDFNDYFSKSQHLNAELKTIRNVRVCLRRIPFEKHTLRRNDHSSATKDCIASKAIVDNLKRLGPICSSMTKPGLKKAAKMPKQVTGDVSGTQCVEKPRNRGTTTSVLNKQQRSSVKKRKKSIDIYDFLSKSQDSNSDVDPAADVIKNLIQSGKVRVATRRTGAGKPKLKRLPSKKIKNIKKDSEHRNKAKSVRTVISPCPQEEDNACDVDDVDVPYEVNVCEEPMLPANKLTTDGAFSTLARSVLLQQTKNNASLPKKRVKYQETERQKLLRIACEFVSTPINKKRPPPSAHTIDASPILNATNQNPAIGNTSCRVNDEVHLPSVFYFNRNSGNLPSFSSDILPCSSNMNFEVASSVPTNSPLRVQDSFLSNDSNAENMPPVSVSENTRYAKDLSVSYGNENLLNLRQQRNPLQQLSNRTPLKAINILEVVTLPPWKPIGNSPNTSEHSAKNKSCVISNNKNLQSCLLHQNNESMKTPSKERSLAETEGQDNLFGFDEFLENVEEEQICTMQERNESLSDKLEKLKKWRPSYRKPLHVSARRSRLFDDDSDQKQPSLMDMFRGSERKQTPRKLVTQQNQVQSQSKADVGQTDEYRILGHEKKNNRRTYSRLFQRKRKCRGDLVLTFSSDESDNDNTRSHEHYERQPEPQVYKKKRRQDTDATTTLKEYVREFNALCEEVEQFQIPIE